MPVSYRTTRRVEFSDTDMAGIMHFARFFVFMEEAEHEFLRSRGLSVVMMHEGRKIGWPRVAASCEFFRPLRFEETVDITVTLARVGSKSLTFAVEFSREGHTMARGQLTTCCCLVTPDGMTAIPMPAELLRRLESE